MNNNKTNRPAKETLHLILYGLVMKQIKEKGLPINHSIGLSEKGNYPPVNN